MSVGFRKPCIDAELANPEDEVGKALGLKAPFTALSLVETMYLAGGRSAQWSRAVFLPGNLAGNLDLHVVRELFETRHLS